MITMLLDDDGYVDSYAELGEIVGGVVYEGALPEDFRRHCFAYQLLDGQLIKNQNKLDQAAEYSAMRQEKEKIINELSVLTEQIRRAQDDELMGLDVTIDIELLKAEARNKRRRQKELERLI